MAQPLEFEAILDTKVVKSTRKKDYLEYLVKWKKRPTEDSTWMSATELEAKGFILVDLMNRGSLFFLPHESDVGASWHAINMMS